MASQDVRRCPSCDAPWTDASARFCGQCGSALPGTSTDDAAPVIGPAPDHGASVTTSTPRQRLTWVGLGAVALLAVIGVTVAFGAGSVDEPADDRDDQAVELPEPEDVTEEPSADPDPDTAPGGDEEPEPVEVRCEGQDDCVLWRRGSDTTQATVVGESLVVLGAPAPGSEGGRSITVSGLSPESGEPRWEQVLDIAEDSTSGTWGFLPLDDDLVAVGVGATLHVLHTDGTRQWTQNLGRQIGSTQVGPEGEVLVTLTGQDSSDGAAGDDEPIRPAEGAPDDTIVQLDREDGSEQWGIEPVTPLISTASHAIVGLEGGGVATLDLGTGELRNWSQEAAAYLTEDNGPWGSRGLDVDGELLRVVDDRDVVAVIDIAAGQVETTVEFDIPPEHQIQLAGELALLVDHSRLVVQAYRLTDPDTPTVSWDSDSGFALLGDATLTVGTLGRGHLPRPPTTEAVAIAETDDDEAQITILERDGTTRSVTTVGTDLDVSDACCPVLQPGGDPRWLLVELPTATGPVVMLFDTVDGQVVRRYDEQPSSDRILIGRTVVATDEATTRLWWPDAEVEVDHRPLLLSAEGIPVLWTPEGIVALDPEVIDPS